MRLISKFDEMEQRIHIGLLVVYLLVFTGIGLPQTEGTIAVADSNQANEIEVPEIILEESNSIKPSLEEIKRNQQIILQRLENIDNKLNSVKELEQNNPNDKVFNIPVGDSFILGPPNARVTVTKWMDFQ